VVVLAAGCGSSSKSSSTQLCGDVASVQSSVQALKNVSIVQNGVSSLQSALDKVKTDASKRLTRPEPSSSRKSTRWSRRSLYSIRR